MLLCPIAFAAIPDEGISIGAQQYALEPTVSSRLDFFLSWKSEDLLKNSDLPYGQLHFDSFIESGKEGDKSFDIPLMAWRLPTRSRGHFWLGRVHPLDEDGMKIPVHSTGAIGNNWVQNQSNALEPRVVGWFGAGWSGDLQKVRFTVAISPLFLPSFGPRLDLSEQEKANGSRFARLPPAYLNTNGTLLPMRYRLDTGDIQKIVFQVQTFLSLGLNSTIGSFQLMTWSAPIPSAQPDAAGYAKPDDASDELNALATVVPKFPREVFIASRWTAPGKDPAILEAAYEKNSGRLSLSAEVQPWSFLRAGALQSVETVAKPAPSGPVVESPVYGRDLFWTELSTKLFRARLRPSLRIEHHFTQGREGDWVRPLLQYQPDPQFVLYASANLIAGRDQSYYGQWRSLDSITTGVRYQW